MKKFIALAIVLIASAFQSSHASQSDVDGMVSTGYVSKGAILGASDGAIWVASSGYNITGAEASTLATAFNNGNIQTTGATLDGVKFFTLQFSAGDKFYGRKGATGVCIAKSGSALVIGEYAEGMTPANCNLTVEGLRDYLVGLGY